MLPVNLKKLNSLDFDRNFFCQINDKNNENFVFNNRGIALITSQVPFCDSIRKSLEKFKNHFKNISIYDAGYLEELDSYDFSALVDQLNHKYIIPVFLGISIEDIGITATNLEKSVMQISNNVNNFTHSTKFIKNNYISFQRHLCELDDMHEIENYLYNSMSLGKLRTHTHLTEPVLREAELLYLNLNSLRASESSGVFDALPTGLNSEELCQLVKYAGTANQLNAVFFEIDGLSEDNLLMSNIIGECIWYLAEGINMKILDHPLDSNDFVEFVVSGFNEEDDLVFLLHNISNRWWVKKVLGSGNQYLACSFEEYQMAVNNEIPERILKFLHSN
ncbi:MAG: hypothetical protein IPN86_08350 [Saprospiraceae bacterium]|nr:hypothetical protein [Saprospiraceae bacterium]